MSNGSTGPTTIEGKERAARNAFKHGIHAVRFVIQPFESPEEFEDFRDGIAASIQPVGDLEHILSERLAISLWIRRRLDYHQAALTIRGVARAENDLKVSAAYGQGTIAEGVYPEVSETRVLATQLSRTILPAEELTVIMRHEAHLRRGATSLIHEIEALQTRRKGGHAPLTRLDISGSANP